VQSEWQNQGETAYPFDPLRFEYSEERENMLKQNSIKYMIIKDGIFEPSAQGSKTATKLDIIYLTPENYYNETNPWKPDINPYLKEVWSYEYSGQKLARLFEINLN
jgi:hypothetical protein